MEMLLYVQYLTFWKKVDTQQTFVGGNKTRVDGE